MLRTPVKQKEKPNEPLAAPAGPERTDNESIKRLKNNKTKATTNNNRLEYSNQQET